MSDEASSSAAAARAARDLDEDGEDRPAPPPSAADIAKKRRKNREMFKKKRGELLDDLLRGLDILVYAELSVIYYMDCSFILFLIRAFVQFLFLTPKPAVFPVPPTNRPYVGAIFGSNLLCIILHAIYDVPSAGEATRFYLHGGLIMDFIGQKGPSSKFHLLLLDCLVILLQVAHLSAHITRQRLKDGAPATAIAVTTPSGRQYNAAPTTSSRQDVDAEERGVRRSQDGDEAIEMQTFNPPNTASARPESSEPAVEASSESSALLSTSQPATGPTDAHIFDAFNSGQIILADLSLWSTVKEQFLAYRDAVPESSATSARDMRANIIGQLLRWRFGGATPGGAGRMG